MSNDSTPRDLPTLTEQLRTSEVDLSPVHFLYSPDVDITIDPETVSER